MIVEKKTVLGTDGILAQVPLGSAGRCTALGNLILLAVRASDCDKCRHGALLALGHSQHKTQCDIDLSRPPLLRHYRVANQTVNYFSLSSKGAQKLILKTYAMLLSGFRFLDTSIDFSSGNIQSD